MKYHSTMSSIDYMKSLGLREDSGDTDFHDLDEVMASSIAERKLPRWVKEVDKPTVEIDWTRMKRFDGTKTMFNQSAVAEALGAEEGEHLAKLRGLPGWARNVRKNKAGTSLKDVALLSGAMLNMFHNRPPQPLSLESSFLGPRSYFSPEDLGVPRWKGTPEEATRIVRAAAKFYGASTVGVTEVDEKTRKLFYARDAAGNSLPPEPSKDVVFEDVDEAYETDKKRVIPYKIKSVIVFTIRMSQPAIATSNSYIADTAVAMGYSQGFLVSIRLQQFLRALGYQCLAESNINGSLANSGGFGVLSGLGELSRLNRVITPEYGPMVRIFKIVTDLPMAPTKPIDAGIWRFCRTCKKCAEACPSKCLSMGEPSWEVTGFWNNPGVKAYYEYAPRCMAYWRTSATWCGICFSVCPFSNLAKEDKPLMHEGVAQLIATTPALDGLITRMDRVSGHAYKDAVEWWDIDLPAHGYDTMLHR